MQGVATSGSPVPPFTAAAAVLTSFDPASLRPAGEVEDPDLALGDLLLECRPAGEEEHQRWQLEEFARRNALLRLGHEEDGLRRALNANAGQLPDDPVQRGLTGLIEGRDPALDKLSLEDLLGLARASDWLEGAVPKLPPPDELQMRIGRERLLRPFRRLVTHFVGRSEELAWLHDFVRETRSGTILSLHGPGGIGKSTLLARFIMEAVEPESLGLRAVRRPFCFAYLDADRTVLDPSDPASFAREAIRQLAVQYQAGPQGFHLVQQMLDAVSGPRETVQFESAAPRLPAAVTVLLGLIDFLTQASGRPVLFVVDTWEEVQSAGPSGELAIGGLLSELVLGRRSVRVICSGRAPFSVPLTSIAVEPVEIGEFDETTAEAYLASMDWVPAEVIGLISKAVGRAPLNLALAARVVQREGPEAAADLAKLVAKVKAEQVQGMLYTRVLEHIHDRDEDLRKLAHPGLAVRRITPDVIWHVLAGPCDVVVQDRAKAEDLFRRLAAEPALVEPDQDDEKVEVNGLMVPPLRHRSDLRRLALPDIKRTKPEEVEAIHRAAVAWYSEQQGFRARAEQLYHMLALGDVPPIEAWQPALQQWLRGATLAELPPRSRLWLLERLGLPLDAETRAAASLDEWERDTAQQVRNLLISGLWRDAIALLEERPQWSAASPLWTLQAQALMQGGELVRARQALQQAIAVVGAAGEPGHAFELHLLLTEVHARAGDWSAASRTLAEAKAFEATAPEIERLRSAIAALRLQRRQGAPEADPAAKREAEAYLANPALRRQLERRPALLREVAAELGLDHPDLVARAVEILGIGRVQLVPQLAPIKLPAWIVRPLARVVSTRAAAGDGKTFLVRLGVDLLRSAAAMTIGANPAAVVGLVRLGSIIASEFQKAAPPALLKWCVGIYRDEVDAISAGKVKQPGL
jgi:hypothetical protein